MLFVSFVKNHPCRWKTATYVNSKAKLLAHDWSSGFLARAYAIEKLLQREKFAITMASHFEIASWQEMHPTIKRQEWKWKTLRKSWSTGRMFLKSGLMKETYDQI